MRHAIAEQAEKPVHLLDTIISVLDIIPRRRKCRAAIRRHKDLILNIGLDILIGFWHPNKDFVKKCKECGEIHNTAA